MRLFLINGVRIKNNYNKLGAVPSFFNMSLPKYVIKDYDKNK